MPHLTDLVDLPSNTSDLEKEDAKKQTERDKEINKEIKLRGWELKKFQCFTMYIDCVKRCLLYSPTDHLYVNIKLAVQQRFESISERYTCGNILFDDSHPLSKVAIHKQSVIYVSPIENGYFVNKQRNLKLKPICYHCGENGSTDHLWGLDKSFAKNTENGYQCFPLCENRHNNRKLPGNTGGKQDHTWMRKECQTILS